MIREYRTIMMKMGRGHVTMGQFVGLTKNGLITRRLSNRYIIGQALDSANPGEMVDIRIRKSEVPLL
jgi:hypothetical protein